VGRINAPGNIAPSVVFPVPGLPTMVIIGALVSGFFAFASRLIFLFLQKIIQRLYRAPVGKVNVMQMFPMSFEEYLMARGESQVCGLLGKKDWASINILHDRLTKLLREYYFVGGMPEAVKTFIDTNDVNAVR
jgi:hypothetical protein